MAKRTKKDEFSLETNKDRERFYKKMDKDQLALFNSIQDNIFTFCEAKSGTGKTVVSINSLLHLLFTNNINHIVYIQKASDRYLEHGFLPGSAEEKTFALWTPFYEAMATLGYQPSMVDKFREQESIILTTDSNLRGINFEKCGIILDEAENCDTETLKLIFTRCHDDCHVVLLGDRLQKDNKGNHNQDFVEYGDYLANSSVGNKCYLTKNYRGKFSQLAEEFKEEL